MNIFDALNWIVKHGLQFATLNVRTSFITSIISRVSSLLLSLFICASPSLFTSTPSMNALGRRLEVEGTRFCKILFVYRIICAVQIIQMYSLAPYRSQSSLCHSHKQSIVE